MQKQCCFETAAHRCWSAGWGRASPAAGHRGLAPGLLHPVHGHQHTGQLLQRDVPQLRREGARRVLQTHQPAGVTWEQIYRAFQSRGLKLTKERTINSLLLLLDQQNSTFRNYFLIFKTSHGDTLKLLKTNTDFIKAVTNVSLVIK